jgi:hypothetical protein
MVIAKGYDNTSVARKVKLTTNAYTDPTSGMQYIKSIDSHSSQYNICLNYLPPGIAYSDIKQGQYWWIERKTTLWTLLYYVSDSGPNLMDVYQAQVKQQINTATRGYQGYQGNQGYQGYQGYQGFQGYQGYQGYQGTAVSNSAWVSSTSDSNLSFSSATASSATVTVGGGFTNYLVLYNGYQGSSQASVNGNIYSLSYAASGATFISGDSARGFSYSPNNATNRPAYSDMRILIMSSTSSFTLTPFFTMGGTGQTGYVSGNHITVVGLS